MNRRIFHLLIALVLVACVVSPWVESALDCHDNMFSTGYDGESTLAIVVLLLELVLSLASLLIFLQPNGRQTERVNLEQSHLTSALPLRVSIPDSLLQAPLRI
jgi:hypothetical protein